MKLFFSFLSGLRFVSSVALLGTCAISSALAGDVVIDSKIDKVQIFPGGATLTFIGDVSLPAGASSLLFENFPDFVDLNTVKASGEFSQEVTIRSINDRVNTDVILTSAQLTPLLEKLEELQETQSVRADSLKTAQAQMTVVEEFSRLAARGFSDALSKRPDAMADWPAVLAAIKEGKNEGQEEIRTIQKLVSETKKEIVALEADISRIRNTLSRRSIAVEVNVAAAAQGKIQLSYQTWQASWNANYDAMLNLDEGNAAKLELVQLASVSQSTGRDWNNVSLSLSTTRPAHGTRAPELTSVRVFERDEIAPVSRNQSKQRQMRQVPVIDGVINMAAKPQALGGAEQEVVLQSAVASAAVQEDVGFQAVYLVKGRVSIPGNGQSRRYTIAQHRLEPELLAVSVPHVQKVAFLHAQLKNETGGALLAGPLALYRDDVYVGRSEFKLMAVGDMQSIGFGVDDKVSVGYVVEDRSVGEQGIINTEKTDTQRYSISVENRHDEAIRIRVLGRVPYSENDQIKVTRLSDFTRPTSENVGNQRGVLAWSHMYEPGQKRDISLAYRLSWPADINVQISQ